jgi:hypothetical protein
MGREAQCTGEFDGFRGTGKLLLETDELVFRAEQRLVLARASIREAAASGDWLEIGWAGGRARFEVGRSADRWVQDILHPKSRVDKLEVKPASRVAIIAVPDKDFFEEVAARAARADRRPGKGPYDFIFYRADSPRALDRLTELRGRIQNAGAVWIITPKGDPAMKHETLVAAAKRAGLIDTKTARFSETHTALKLVIPKGNRTG